VFNTAKFASSTTGFSATGENSIPRFLSETTGKSRSVKPDSVLLLLDTELFERFKSPPRDNGEFMSSFLITAEALPAFIEAAAVPRTFRGESEPSFGSRVSPAGI